MDGTPTGGGIMAGTVGDGIDGTIGDGTVGTIGDGIAGVITIRFGAPLITAIITVGHITVPTDIMGITTIHTDRATIATTDIIVLGFHIVQADAEAMQPIDVHPVLLA